jgi:hypothetical protein
MAFCVLGLTVNARPDVELGVSADEDGLREFHMAIGDFYNVPEKEVVVVRERRIPEEELPVVFFIARRARVEPIAVAELRLGGRPWIEIAHYYGMGAEIFHVESATASGPPYGAALGHYKGKSKKQWRYIKLADNDVVNLVNLKFISSHYGYSPNTVIRLRSDGKSFMAINKDIKAGKIAKAPNKSENKKAVTKKKSSGSKGSKGNSKKK